MLNTERLNELIELKRARAVLQKELKDNQEKIDALEQWAIDHLAENDCDGIKLNGSQLYIMDKVYYKRLGSPHDVKEALKAAGLEDFLSIGTQALTAFITERINNDEPLPPEFEGIIGYSEESKIGIRKA